MNHRRLSGRLLAVAVAAMGAIEFGYHIAILNGPLELISSQLGFAGKQTLLGGVRVPFLRLHCLSPSQLIAAQTEEGGRHSAGP